MARRPHGFGGQTRGVRSQATRMRTVERRYKEFAALRKQARQWPRQ